MVSLVQEDSIIFIVNCTASGQQHTAQWLINSDTSNILVTKKDKNGDTPAHDAADNG